MPILAGHAMDAHSSQSQNEKVSDLSGPTVSKDREREKEKKGRGSYRERRECKRDKRKNTIAIESPWIMILPSQILL